VNLPRISVNSCFRCDRCRHHGEAAVIPVQFNPRGWLDVVLCFTCMSEACADLHVQADEPHVYEGGDS
jgi:hypothetical protein